MTFKGSWQTDKTWEIGKLLFIIIYFSTFSGEIYIHNKFKPKQSN